MDLSLSKIAPASSYVNFPKDLVELLCMYLEKGQDFRNLSLMSRRFALITQPLSSSSSFKSMFTQSLLTLQVEASAAIALSLVPLLPDLSRHGEEQQFYITTERAKKDVLAVVHLEKLLEIGDVTVKVTLQHDQRNALSSLFARHATPQVGSTNWIAGKREGIQCAYFKKRTHRKTSSNPEPPKLKSITTWRADMKDGASEMWNNQGVKVASIKYADNKQQGLTQAWYDDGRLRYTSHWENNVKSGEELEYNAAGQKIKSCVWKKGKKQKELLFNNAGSMKYSCPFICGKKNGQEVTIDSDGNKKQTLYLLGVRLLSRTEPIRVEPPVISVS